MLPKEHLEAEELATFEVVVGIGLTRGVSGGRGWLSPPQFAKRKINVSENKSRRKVLKFIGGTPSKEMIELLLQMDLS